MTEEEVLQAVKDLHEGKAVTLDLTTDELFEICMLLRQMGVEVKS